MPLDRIRPDYAGANLSNVVPAILGQRDAQFLPSVARKARARVLLVLDGLGWAAVREHAELLPELSGMVGGPITTVVPSTTPAALTSLTTGTPPSRHGITGFRVRSDQGSVLNVISWVESSGRRPPEPEMFQRIEPFGRRTVPVVTKSIFRTTGFTRAHLRGADFHGWETTAVLVEQVRSLVAEGAPFVYAYYAGVDSVAHAHGIHGRHYLAELAAADALVGAVLDALPSDTALLVTADHGQVQVGPDGWISLGAVDRWVETYAGDGRFRHLHARKGHEVDLLKAAFDAHGDDAWVMTREELVDDGWIGPDATPLARRRVGDVVLVARDGVGFIDPDLPGEARLIGAHGSVTPAEVEIPLLAGIGRGA